MKLISNLSSILLIIGVAIASCSLATVPDVTQHSSTNVAQSISNSELSQSQTTQWRRMTEQEEEDAWQYILNHGLGIAALNQLAIEGFISPVCPKTFYLDEHYGGFVFLLRVKCPDQRGLSSAIGYEEIRVIFSRYESTIENFDIERISSEEGNSNNILLD